MERRALVVLRAICVGIDDHFSLHGVSDVGGSMRTILVVCARHGGLSAPLLAKTFASGPDCLRVLGFDSMQSSETLRVIQEVRKPSDHRLLMVGFEFTTKSTKSMKRLIFHSSPSCSSCPSW